MRIYYKMIHGPYNIKLNELALRITSRDFRIEKVKSEELILLE